MTWTSEQIEQALRTITERGMRDAAFRALALKDARAAIGQVTSEPLPGDFKIQFVDNAGHDLTIVLPDPAPAAARELKEEELAGVAGGTETYTVDFGNISAACQTKNLTACNPSYTRKPGSPAFCPQ